MMLSRKRVTALLAEIDNAARNVPGQSRPTESMDLDGYIATAHARGKADGLAEAANMLRKVVFASRWYCPNCPGMVHMAGRVHTSKEGK